MHADRVFLNPYAEARGGAEPLDVLQASAKRLATMIWPLTAEHLARRSAPGKWTVRAIVCHLADMEIVFGFRLRQTLSEPHHVIQVCDQLHGPRTDERMDVTGALEMFRTTRD